MLITKEQAEKRLKSEKNLANLLNNSNGKIVPIVKAMGGLKQNTVPQEVKDTAGVLNRIGVSQRQTAALFDIDQSMVNYYKHGKCGANLELIEEKSSQVKDKALNKLMGILGLLTEDKMQNTKPLEISQIAANVSKVHSNLSSNSKNGNSSQVNVTLYAPQVRTEDRYKVVEA